MTSAGKTAPLQLCKRLSGQASTNARHAAAHPVTVSIQSTCQTVQAAAAAAGPLGIRVRRTRKVAGRHAMHSAGRSRKRAAAAALCKSSLQRQLMTCQEAMGTCWHEPHGAHRAAPLCVSSLRCRALLESARLLPPPPPHLQSPPGPHPPCFRCWLSAQAGRRY